MNSRQFRAKESILHALAFLTPKHCKTKNLVQLRARLEAMDDRIMAQAGKQESAFRMRGGDGFKLQRLRQTLRVKHLIRVSRQGKVLLKGLPGIADLLRVPHAKSRDDEFLSAAKRIATEVRPHAKTFIKAGFAKTFIADLEQAAKALEDFAKRAETALNHSARTTMTLGDTVTEAREVLAAADSEVRAVFHYDPHTLELWKGAKRIPAKKGRPRAKRQPDQ